ncbi:MAG: TonB-dependent receptor domain-containing protein [Henriciella sp.]
MTNDLLKKKLFATTLLAGVAGGLWAGAAIAQEADDEVVTVIEEVDEDDEARQDKVVVTGSRLSRNEFTSVSPLQIVDGEQARELGLIDAQSLLSNTTVVSGQQNTLGVSTAFNGGLQQAFTTIGNVSPSLRGLGSGVTGRARTLVLVNGRRLGPIGVGGAPANPDISLIPGSLVSQVDVLLDGASSIYGSDAVAGVVNYVLRKDFDGVEVNYFRSQSEHGWGANDVLSLTTGVNNDRGFIGFSLEYNNQDDITRGDALSAFFGPVSSVSNGFTGTSLGNLDIGPQFCEVDIGVLPDGSERRVCSGTPAGFAIVGGVGNVIGELGGPITPGSTPLAGAPGFFVRPPVSFFRPDNDPATRGFPQDLSDTYLPPTERVSIYTVGEYNLNTYGDMTLFFEGNYGNRQLETRNTAQEILPFTADNPFNPFGGPGLFVYSVEQGVDQEIDVARGLFGVRGDLPDVNVFGTDNWSYEASLSLHRSNGFQALTGFLNEDRIAQGLNSSVDPATGDITCSVPQGTNPATGGTAFFGFDTVRAPLACVPLNPFVPEFLVAGQFATPEQNEFAYGVGTVQTEVEQLVFNAFVQGELFEFPQGGTAQFLLGTEYREDQVVTTPGDSTRFGLLQGVDADLGATGQRDIYEGFAEISLPILENQPWAQSLLLEGAARWTEEEFSGSAWTYQIKGEYGPTDYLTFRAGFGTSFRAPDLGEQFGTGTVFVQPSRIDPCVVNALQLDPTTGAYDPALETRDPIVIQNCIDIGLDPTTLGTVNQGDGDPTTTAFVSLPVAFGNFGNQGVSPEESEALFAGFVFDQPFFDEFDFQVAATYFEYEITGQIGQLTRGQILGDCFDSVGLTDPLCAFQTRDASGNLVAVNEASINLGPTTSRGMDININAAYELTRFTEDPIDLTWDLVLTQSFENNDEVTPGTVTENLGQLTLGGGFPEYNAVSTIRADWKDWAINFRSRFISDLIQNPDQGNAFAACFDLVANARIDGCVEKELTDHIWQHDLTMSYTADSWSVRGGVLNLFDEIDSIDSNFGLANVPIQSGADIFGRRFFVGVSKSF